MRKKGKKSQWVTTQIEDGEVKYKFEPHNKVKHTCFPWVWCPKCGLMFLRNRLTSWCSKMGCDYSYHAQYQHEIRKGT